MKTFKAIVKQEILLTLRTPENIFLGLGFPIGFFLLFSSIWGNDQQLTAEQLAVFIRQYMFQMTAFASLSFSFMTLPYAFLEDRTGNRLKNIQHSPVPVWQYYLAKIMRVLFLFILAIIGVFLVGHFIKGVNLPSLQDWFISGGLLFFGASCTMPFGILLGFIKSAEKLSIIGNIAYMALAILGGLWMPVSMFPDIMQKIGKLTPTYHLNNLVTSYIEKDFSTQSLLILVGYAIIVLVIALAVGKKLEVK